MSAPCASPPRWRALHYVLHAPQGDTYADLLFTMIERRPGARRSPTRPSRPATSAPTPPSSSRPPAATPTSGSARGDAGRRVLHGRTHPGRSRRARPRARPARPGRPARTALLPEARRTGARRRPSTSSSASWPGHRSRRRARRAHRVTPAAARAATFSAPRSRLPPPRRRRTRSRPCSSASASTSMSSLPRARPLADLARLGEADFNVVLYPEIAGTAARWLERSFGQPRTTTVPIGVGATRASSREVAALAGVDPAPALDGEPSRLPWYSRSIDSTYLTGKRVFVFGDATHAVAAARIASEELAFSVVGLGTYAREFARDVREAAARHGVEALITDDYLEVEAAVAELQPELVLGTQMERHIAKRLGIPCAVISAPVHVQDFPARYSPQMGFEGANVIFDTLGPPADDGAGGAPPGHVPRRLRVQRRAAPSHLARGGRAAPAATLTDAAPTVAGLGDRSREGASARSPSSCAERRAATPNASPWIGAWPPSPSRHCTMRKPISAAERDARARRHRDPRQPSGGRRRSRARTAARASFPVSRCRCMRRPNGATTPARSPVAGPTSRPATSSSPRCSSSTTTSRQCCRT